MTENFCLSCITQPLLDWYRENKRILPWREGVTPYRVWVSEIMLQQTRVEAVKEYYVRFLKELPTVEALADCEEGKLMKLWEGLGYYSRVRNMQKAARVLVREYGSRFPDTEREIRALPGIGDYTAGAVLSIAYGKPVPAIDGNVLRVLSRVLENPTEISDLSYRAFLREELKKAYPKEGADCSDFTQSLMELGALICTPRSPKCAECPLRELCGAEKHGSQGKYPVLPKKKEKRSEKVYVFVIETASGIAVRRREEGVLKGMNEFPSHIAEEGTPPEEILESWGVSSFRIVRSKNYTHVFTHIRWDMTCFYVRAEKSPFPAYSEEALEKEVSLPTAFRQCAEIRYLLA